MSNTESAPTTADASEAGAPRGCCGCVDRRTLTLKVLYVTLFAGVVVVWVQLGPYQKSLGLTERDTGVMSVVGSSMIIVGPIVTGLWADALGDFRRLVAATALLNGLVAFGFTMIPPAPSIGNVSLKTDNSSTNLCLETLTSSSDNLSGLRTDLDQSLNLNKSNLSQDFNSDKLSSLKHDLTNDTDLTTLFLHSSSDDGGTAVVLGNYTSYYVSHNSSSFRYNLPDVGIDSGNSLAYSVGNVFDDHTVPTHTDHFSDHTAPADTDYFGDYTVPANTNVIGDHTVPADTDDTGDHTVPTTIAYFGDNTVPDDTGNFGTEGYISAPDKYATKISAKISPCVIQKRTPDESEIAEMKAVTYWTYLALHASFMLLNSATISMFESSVLAAVAEHDINYGRQRCFASLAATVSAPVGGILVDMTGSRDDKSNYRTVLYTSCSLMVVSSALLLTMDMSFKKPAVVRLKSLPAVFANVRLLALFFVTFLAGLLMGYGETFVYRYLHGLGASAALLGSTVTVGGCIEGLLMVFLSYILAFTGVYFCFVAGFLCFALKFLGLYVLQNPWLALPLETLDSISTGMFMAVASLQLTALVPSEALASMRGLLGTTYMGVGKMTGAAVGTAVVGAYGVRLSWAIMSAVAFAVTILLTLGVLLFKSFKKYKLFKKMSNDSLQTVSAISISSPSI